MAGIPGNRKWKVNACYVWCGYDKSFSTIVQDIHYTNKLVYLGLFVGEFFQKLVAYCFKHKKNTGMQIDCGSLKLLFWSHTWQAYFSWGFLCTKFVSNFRFFFVLSLKRFSWNVYIQWSFKPDSTTSNTCMAIITL